MCDTRTHGGQICGGTGNGGERSWLRTYVCVCVCERERERERESFCPQYPTRCVSVYACEQMGSPTHQSALVRAYTHTYIWVMGWGMPHRSTVLNLHRTAFQIVDLPNVSPHHSIGIEKQCAYKTTEKHRGKSWANTYHYIKT